MACFAASPFELIIRTLQKGLGMNGMNPVWLSENMALQANFRTEVFSAGERLRYVRRLGRRREYQPCQETDCNKGRALVMRITAGGHRFRS